MRNRERKALCYRSKETVEVLAYLFSEFYNYRRGHGLVETPFEGFNQIDVNRIGEQLHPITIRHEKYGQQFTTKVSDMLLHHQNAQLVQRCKPGRFGQTEAFFGIRDLHNFRHNQL